MKNKKKLIVFGGILLTVLIFTTGTFAFGYNGQATAELNGATIADGAWATYEPSAVQPDWTQVLPNGNLSSEILSPNGGGDTTNINQQYPLSGEHWDKVDDYPTSDEAATYVTTTTGSYQMDLYNLADPQPQVITETRTIKSITIYYRVNYTANAADGASAMSVIKTYDTVFTGSAAAVSSANYTTFSYNWAGNPSTGKLWTWDEITNLQAGISMKAAKKNNINCTQLYVAVNIEKKIIQSEVPEGNLFDITPDHNYLGDLHVNIYLTNTAALIKAYSYLNIELYVKNSIEAKQTPFFQMLTLTNGVASFNIEGGSALQYQVQVWDGAYRLISTDTTTWADGWSVTPELYCEVTQR
jgi:hypothetical protein